MKPRIFSPADILLPKNCDMTKWSSIACDQHTSEPEYWERCEAFVGDAPSTLHLTIPELRYRDANMPEMIKKVRATADEYLDKGLFERFENSYLYIERTLASGLVRRGLMGQLDLEQYDNAPHAKTLIRATEGVVREKLPSRISLRDGARMEMSHVMVLIDDPKETLIEPLTAKRSSMQKLYDFPLMEGGGSIAAWRVTGGDIAPVDAAIDRLLNPESFAKRYNAEGEPVLIFAIGDGNHSLSTAKACWERMKPSLSSAEQETHPARFALVELINIMDPVEKFEPIHRVIFDTDTKKLRAALLSEMEGAVDGEVPGAAHIRWRSGSEKGVITLTKLHGQLAVGDFTAFIDSYIAREGCRIDYIHEDAVALELASRENTICFLMPDISKSDFFPSIIKDGAMPRKTFSMGHSADKRYYLECRSLEK